MEIKNNIFAVNKFCGVSIIINTKIFRHGNFGGCIERTLKETKP